MIGLLLLVISLIIAGIGLYRAERMMAIRRDAAANASSRQLDRADFAPGDTAQLNEVGAGQTAELNAAAPPSSGDGMPMPFRQGDGYATDRQPARTGSRSVNKEGYILVVDLDQKVRERLSEMLSTSYEIREASDASAAIGILTRAHPQIAIVGSNVRDRHGRPFWEWMCRSDTFSTIPLMLVSALTAHEDVSERFDHLEFRPSAVLRKPLLLDEVSRTVSRLVESNEEVWTTDVSRFSRAGDEDDRFVRRAQEEVESRIGDAGFGVRELSEELGLSARQLQRRLRDTTGLSPNAFIRSIRLQRAARILEQGSEPVSQVAYSVGFNSLSYFAKCFREHFGRNPSEFTVRRPHLPV